MTDPHILAERRGAVGFITLNRPEALNALSLGMIQGIRDCLAVWRDDPDIGCVVFRGAGDRAFCAGGDVKKIYEAGAGVIDPLEKTALARVYFAGEYRMNRELFHYPKPTIAFMNGITMGGGFGVAGACRIRIASEKTVFAMPEVGIGFFPDVGSVYSLTRCPHRAGYWLALTGNTIKAADMLALGLATHFARADDTNTVLDHMAAQGEFVPPPPANHHCELPLNEIEKIFSIRTLEGVFERLNQSRTLFEAETLKTMLTRSPTSMKLTLAYLRRMEGESFDAVTAMDYRLAIACMQGHEFYEGIRAALVDKDKAPQWRPGRAGDVDDGVIESYFSETRPDLDQAG